MSGSISEFAPPWTGSAPYAPGQQTGSMFCAGLITEASSPSIARRMARVILAGWRVSPEDISTPLLLVSELVTNAVTFGKAPLAPHPSQISLTLWRLGKLLVIEVSDQSAQVPVRRDASPDSEGGRGLNLVNDLSQEWGHYIPRPGWKTVYCVMCAMEAGAKTTMSIEQPEDQVARRIRFSEAHPEVTFNFLGNAGRWEATYPAGKNGIQKVCFTELRHVLDELEKRLGSTPIPQAGKVTDIARTGWDRENGGS
jgi:anti-sigma regulatory factor (Ser/Thr protein kinase)